MKLLPHKGAKSYLLISEFEDKNLFIDLIHKACDELTMAKQHLQDKATKSLVLILFPTTGDVLCRYCHPVFKNEISKEVYCFIIFDLV